MTNGWKANGSLPRGIEIFRNPLCIRFTWTLLRRVIAETDWTSANVKRNAITRLATILDAATREGLLTKNPAALIELPKRSRKEIDPLTLAEAKTIINKMYEHKHWPSLSYGAMREDKKRAGPVCASE